MIGCHILTSEHIIFIHPKIPDNGFLCYDFHLNDIVIYLQEKGLYEVNIKQIKN